MHEQRPQQAHIYLRRKSRASPTRNEADPEEPQRSNHQSQIHPRYICNPSVADCHPAQTPNPATKPTSVCRTRDQLPHSTTPAQQLLNFQHSSKSVLNSNLFKLIYHFKQHNVLSTLSYTSNPSQAWGTYAPGRAYAFISKDLASHTKHSLNTPRGIRLLHSYTILNKKSLTYSLITHSNYVCLQLSPSNMTGPTKPHTRHHNSNHTNEIVMDDVTPPIKRTSPNSTKFSHKKSKSNGSIISLYRDPSQMEFLVWISHYGDYCLRSRNTTHPHRYTT